MARCQRLIETQKLFQQEHFYSKKWDNLSPSLESSGCSMETLRNVRHTIIEIFQLSSHWPLCLNLICVWVQVNKLLAVWYASNSNQDLLPLDMNSCFEQEHITYKQINKYKLNRIETILLTNSQQMICNRNKRLDTLMASKCFAEYLFGSRIQTWNSRRQQQEKKNRTKIYLPHSLPPIHSYIVKAVSEHDAHSFHPFYISRMNAFKQIEAFG